MHVLHKSLPIRPFAWLIPALLLALPGVGLSQEAPATLSLEEAISIAMRNNPNYLAQRNDEAEADWAVREAYGALVPTASLSAGAQYQAGGQQRFGVFTGEDLGVGRTSGYLLSSYSIGLGYRLGGETLFRPTQARADRRATQARIDAAAFQLAADVSQRYLAALAAHDGVELARSELQRADENLRLAEARVAVGSAIRLEAMQAEVERGRAEVELVRAQNLLRTETLRLLEVMGVELDREVELTSDLPIFEPTWSLDDLVATALRGHPQLHAMRAAEDAANTGVRMARMQYLPTLSLSAGWSGYTREATNDEFLLEEYRNGVTQSQANCLEFNQILSRLNPPLPTQDCSQIAVDPATEADIRAQNNMFPFDFAREPFSASLQISLPVFNGFSRERTVASARVAAEDARYQLRAEQLRIEAEVAAAHANIQTAYRAVMLEERNRDLADEQLILAREQYRVGSTSFVDLVDAETRKSQADRAYLSAVYEFHNALAALEAAVGTDLRGGPDGGA